jgi:hypothetical protein
VRTSKAYLEDIRRHASKHLSPTFAHDVIQVASLRRRARIQLQVVAVTASICILTAVSVHWVRTEFAERRNLEAWNRIAAQVRVLEESI